MYKKEDDHCGNISDNWPFEFILFFFFQTEDTDYEKQSNAFVLQVKSQARQQTQTNVENKKNWF